MSGGKPKLNRIFWVSWSCSQLLGLRVKEFVLKSPVSLTDSQPPSFDHFEWSEQEECSVKWEISHSAQVSQSHNISLVSGSVCNAEVRQDSLLPSPAKTLILGNVSFSVSRSLLRALCSTAVPISEERIPVEYYWALIHVWIILYSNLFLEWTFSSLDLFPSLCLIPDLLWTKGRIIIFCSPANNDSVKSSCELSSKCRTPSAKALSSVLPWGGWNTSLLSLMKEPCSECCTEDAAPCLGHGGCNRWRNRPDLKFPADTFNQAVWILEEMSLSLCNS